LSGGLGPPELISWLSQAYPKGCWPASRLRAPVQQEAGVHSALESVRAIPKSAEQFLDWVLTWDVAGEQQWRVLLLAKSLARMELHRTAMFRVIRHARIWE
jgi:hypothetical protein